MPGIQVLIVGGGGREHALAWALARSRLVGQIYVAPGNAGTKWEAAEGCAPSANVLIEAENIFQLVAFAREKAIDLTVVGPEVPLAAGIVDAFQVAGLRIFGPTQAAAQLETSKAFAKAFMREQGILTAEYATFTDYESARQFVEAFGRAVVVKADGLAAGKGVIVCNSFEEADIALRRIMLDHEFGASGSQVVIEERLSGSEVSALAFSDGKTVALMPLARDHKRVNEGDQGANTGGMGAYAPMIDVPDDLPQTVLRQVLQPAIDGMAARRTPYVGVLYAGLMLTQDGVRVLEFNCRFGDPETQVILPLLDGDLADIMLACIESRLEKCSLHWLPGACATVVLTSPGYPVSYPKGLPISGLGTVSDEVVVFHAGTAEQGGQIVTAGGRVLAVSARGDSLTEALKRAYNQVGRIQFEGVHFRRDIGHAYEKVEQ